LLPNSVDGWWLYKNYLPNTPETARTWAARQALLQAAIFEADADVVCIQEASGKSEFRKDFGFMFKHGYEGTIAANGRMRCATFWRPDVVQPVLEPISKDRTLVVPFRVLTGNDTACNKALWVINSHLAAGAEPGRRLRQTHEALQTVTKQRKQLQADQVDLHEPALVFCGDLNVDDELEGRSAVDCLLTEGIVEKGFVDPFYPNLGAITSKTRRQSCGEFVDAYRLAFEEPPATLLAPMFEDRFFDGVSRSELTPELLVSLEHMFLRYARSSDSDIDAAKEKSEPLLDEVGVERWLLDINRELGRGSEYRAAQAALNSSGERRLTMQDFVKIYVSELDAGKLWGVAHDLWATSCAEGCLPNNAAELGTYHARFDRIYLTPAILSVQAVRHPSQSSTGQSVERSSVPLPNEWSGIDHLPIGATISLRT